jgi:antitoxin (DNA-binding transcriptional repressor) of toxin-antitoxin stability system
MEPYVVGIREFRARLADFILKGDRPVAVTRHGATVGYFIPARAGHPDLDRAALKRLKAGEANRAANFTTGFQEFAAPACP